jgi:hypothetical protein
MKNHAARQNLAITAESDLPLPPMDPDRLESSVTETARQKVILTNRRNETRIGINLGPASLSRTDGILEGSVLLTEVEAEDPEAKTSSIVPIQKVHNLVPAPRLHLVNDAKES